MSTMASGLDGEAVARDDNGFPSFDRLRRRQHDASVFYQGCIGTIAAEWSGLCDAIKRERLARAGSRGGADKSENNLPFRALFDPRETVAVIDLTRDDRGASRLGASTRDVYARRDNF